MQHPNVSGNKRKQPEPATPAQEKTTPKEPSAPLLLRRVARRERRPATQDEEPEDIDSDVIDSNGNLEGRVSEEIDSEAEIEADHQYHLEDQFVPETPEEQLPPKKRSAFRLQAKTVFCTYPQCPIPPEDALKQLTHKWGLAPMEYVIGREKHQVSASPPSTPPSAPYLSATALLRNTEAQNKAFFKAAHNYFYLHALETCADSSYLYE